MLTNDEANSPMGIAARKLAFAMQHGEHWEPAKTSTLQEAFYTMASAVADDVVARILSQFSR